ncbi:hypothetical protein [Actinoallomurus soli]|uniref:hypothetical protein n=1 Tax=Actinoallomurus soli TaxID=2952535 RepID=UPI0020935C5C|nr:hypothetical protein [Actinoallomurus soli]MCO5967249.1 hypothetical protein [Actinoallomurus soli]
MTISQLVWETTGVAVRQRLPRGSEMALAQVRPPDKKEMEFVKIPRKAAVMTIAAFVGLTVPAVPAGAATSASATTGIVNVQGTKHVVSASLAHHINSGDWRGLSTADLARAGIHPNMPFPDGTKIQARTGGVHTDAGSNCIGSVCTYVFGSGLYVSNWDTGATNASGACTYAVYWVTGSVVSTSNMVCSAGQLYVYANPNHEFPNWATLCNTWANLPGEPCETLHP